MEFDHVFQEEKCARCRQAIHSDPAFEDELWYHRTCLEEGKRALQRVQELVVRFGLASADSHTSGGVNKGT